MYDILFLMQIIYDYMKKNILWSISYRSIFYT